jgi:hypothetical protein
VTWVFVAGGLLLQQSGLCESAEQNMAMLVWLTLGLPVVMLCVCWCLCRFTCPMLCALTVQLVC